MVNTTSLVRNAVARLEAGEVSPVWRAPFGYLLVRVQGVGAALLEGEYEDFEYAAREEYLRSRFSQWANGVLSDLE